LDQRREDAFILIHQQLTGLRLSPDSRTKLHGCPGPIPVSSGTCRRRSRRCAHSAPAWLFPAAVTCC
jgi:hypothetical protein